VLSAAGVQFRVHEFDNDPAERGYGLAAAVALGVEPERVFKTLIATIDENDHAVAIVPVSGQLSLKELAVALGAKRAEMCAVPIAERLTGYVVGGISPFGQKRQLPTVIDETCILFDTIFVSGGRRGLDIEIAPDDLITVLVAVTAAISV
jgi:Cys-tRNA(Pro)/Cys-tRNA(Cys) deacylase